MAKTPEEEKGCLSKQEINPSFYQIMRYNCIERGDCTEQIHFPTLFTAGNLQQTSQPQKWLGPAVRQRSLATPRPE